MKSHLKALLKPLFWRLLDLLAWPLPLPRGYYIVMYHRVLEPDERRARLDYFLYLSRACFRRHIAFFKRRCAPMALAEMVERIRRGERPERPYVAITFDDGYRDNFEFVAPWLAGEGVPATYFLATGFIDQPARVPWWDRLIRFAYCKTMDVLAEARRRLMRLRDGGGRSGNRPR